MKLKTLLSIAIVAGMAVIYTACKKSDTSSANALTPAQVSSQVALDLAQNLFGGYGGVNVGQGLDAPGGLAVKQSHGKLLHDLSNPFCGLVIDTTVNETSDPGSDTTASVSGHLYFAFSCTNDMVTGYTTKDNLTISLSTASFSLVSKINEDLSLLAINPADNNSKLILKGTLGSAGTYSYKTGTKKSGTRAFSYVLSSLVLDPNQDDIVAGSASFTTTGTGTTGSWSYIGTITFLGGHKVSITINGKTYNVNLLTGVVG
ncbi:hypothetical protein KXD93_27295 [Mucilaginibacter sp. BJC16-A38]|uniref:hypothetical protein n=1 Tax=Mucilaginibacter phenanthrenivorans TaxID=1234842 RepID=UPI0021584189|nr:hypothetical protein [Mucilaginibacter phenanthrenivorans]MCR8561389.1 hypothetical protein [Mucilaginibacter phenanthrenivorans]